jgi:hypothetical protein
MCAAALAFSAAAIAGSWGGDYWQFDCAVGVQQSEIVV